MTQQQEKTKKPVDVIGERMKGYEMASQKALDPETPWMVRLDGHKFSNFTKSLDKPFDWRMSLSMIQTTSDLISEFNALTGYTESDEITLIFAPVDPQIKGQTLPYNGKVSKLVSLMSAFCSVKFNNHMAEKEWEKGSINESKMAKRMAYFDARAFNLPSKEEALNNLMWRSHYDCERNSTNMLGRTRFSPKAMHGASAKRVREMLKEAGFPWEDQPNFFKYGCLIKRELYEREDVDRKTGLPVLCTRARPVCKSFRLKTFTLERVSLIFSKYWSDLDEEAASECEQYALDGSDFPGRMTTTTTTT